MEECEPIVRQAFANAYKYIREGNLKMFNDSQIFKWKRSSHPTDQERLRQVLNVCCDPESKLTLIMEGIMSHCEIASKLLEINTLNVNKDVEGVSPLHLALENNEYEIAKKLLAKKANPHAVKPQTKETVLHLVVKNQTPKMLKLLLDIMCSREKKEQTENKESLTTTTIAEQLLQTDIVTFCNKDGQTAAHLAIVCEDSLGQKATGRVVSLEMIRIMAQYAKNKSNIFDFFDKNGNFPIHSACTCGKNNTNKGILLEWIVNNNLNNCNVRKKNGNEKGYTPLMIAIKDDNIDCIEVLCSYEKVDICNIKCKIAFTSNKNNVNYNLDDHKETETESHQQSNDGYIVSSNNDDVSALYHAAYKKNTEAVIILLSTILKRDNVHDWKSLKKNKNITVETLKSLLKYITGSNVKTGQSDSYSICDFVKSLIGYLLSDDKTDGDKYANFVLQLRYDLATSIKSYDITDQTMIMHYNLIRYIQVTPVSDNNTNDEKHEEKNEHKVDDIHDYGSRKQLVGDRVGRWIVNKEILGQGGFGTVHLGIDYKTGQTAALKFIKRKKIRNTQQLVNEIKGLQSVRHENVVSLLAYNVNVRLKNETLVMLALEHAINGDLFELVAKVGHFEIVVVKTFLQEIVSGLRAIHRFNIIHGDLKPQNLLLDGNFHIKISDFGLCKFVTKDNSKNIQRGGGTRGYLSPERILNSLKIDKSSDMFSIGVILWNMINGIGKNVEPFEQASPNDSKYKLIANGNYDQFWKEHESTRMISKIEGKHLEGLKYLLLNLFNSDPKNRYTVDSVQKDDWFETVAGCSDQSLKFYCQSVLACDGTSTQRNDRAKKQLGLVEAMIFQSAEYV